MQSSKNIEENISSSYSNDGRQPFKSGFAWSLVLAVFFYCLIGSGLIILFKQSIMAHNEDTERVAFYAREAKVDKQDDTGKGWQYPKQAAGEPEASRAGDESSFAKDNSAYYKWGENILFLENFTTKRFLGREAGGDDSSGSGKIPTSSDSILSDPKEEDRSLDEMEIPATSTPATSTPATSTSGSANEQEESVFDSLPKQASSSIASSSASSNKSASSSLQKDKNSKEKNNNISASSSKGALGSAFDVFGIPAAKAEDRNERDKDLGQFRRAVVKLSLFARTKPESIPDQNGASRTASSVPSVLEEETASSSESAGRLPVSKNKDVRAKASSSTSSPATSLSASDPSSASSEDKKASSAADVLKPESVAKNTDNISSSSASSTIKGASEKGNSIFTPDKETVYGVEKSKAGEGKAKDMASSSKASGSQASSTPEKKGLFRKVLDMITGNKAEAKGEEKVSIWYSVAPEKEDGSRVWHKLSVLDVDEFSNFFHGGYLELEAPLIDSWSDMDGLKVKIKGLKKDYSGFELYLDSLWVEIEYAASDTQEPKEDNEEGEEKNVIEEKGKKIEIGYTDDNKEENLIIKADEKDYFGLTEAEVYFSVENIGVRKEEIDLQFYFPKSSGKVSKVERLYKDKPYMAEVDEYEPVIHTCEQGWEKRDDFYLCFPKGKQISCDEVSPNGKYCRVEKGRLVSDWKIKRANRWEEVKLSEKVIPDKRGFFKRLLGLGPKEKPVPEKFKSEKATDEEGHVIEPGEILYYRMTINFPPASHGEFYIEAIGDADGYGLLDPWWASSWGYRMPIEIDNTANSGSLSEHQVYLELDSAETSFWDNVASDGRDIRFTSEDGVELDHWIQHFATTTATSAKIWVQVDEIPAASTGTIYMYYGNESATSTSNINETFTYSELTPLYYPIIDQASMNLRVVSLIDGNQAQLDEGTPVDLADKGDYTTFSSGISTTSVIKLLGPAYVQVISEDAYDASAPIAFGGTEFVVPSVRNDPDATYVLAPFSDANVDFYNGGSASPDNSKPISAGNGKGFYPNVSTCAIYESDERVIATHNGDTAGDDAHVPYPATTEDIYGIYSNNYYIGHTQDSTGYDIYCSAGTGASPSGQSRGSSNASPACANGAEGAGSAVRIANANNNIGAIQQADTDGNESTTFLPFKEFSNEYVLPVDTAYVALVCAPQSPSMEVGIYNTGDSLVATTSCDGSGNTPGKGYLGNGDGSNYSAGYYIKSDNGAPFYAIYEDVTISGGGDETNLFGAVQARKATTTEPSYTLGAQELIAPPEMKVNSVSRQNNNTGKVDISLDISDVSNDGCKLKIEYVATSTCDFTTPLDPTLATTSATTTYGQTRIDNSEEFQIGTSSSWIDTDNGTNTLSFVWDSETDSPSADGWYCLRYTVNDGSQATSATSTVYLDNVQPTAPGYLSLSGKNQNSVTFSLGTTTTESNFSEYKIFYKVYDGFSVTEQDTIFGSSSDSDLSSIDYNSATTTTITGLSHGTTYTFNIWAYDEYGNRASSSQEINATPNRYPTGSFNSASQKTDGSGKVDISIEVDDADDDECRARLDYVSGTSCDFSSPSDPTIDTGGITADFGTVAADNAETYQVGTTSYYIVTNAGANTVSFDWLSANDIPSADDSYCLRLTVYDGIDNQTDPATTTLILDNQSPSAPGALTSSSIGFTNAVLEYATSSPSTDTNEPPADAYRIFYKVGDLGVNENDSEHNSADLDFYDYGGAATTSVSSLSASTTYVFNIWAYDDYGNSASSASELVFTTRSYLENDSLSFTNAQSSGTTTNILIADGSAEWNFRAVVSQANGYENLSEVDIRLADENDNSKPYQDLIFRWTQSINTFSEEGTDATGAVTLSENSASDCSGDTCTLDFKLIFDKTFATSSVDYSAELYSSDDSAREDSDSYDDIYQVRKNWLKQIHYRWRNDDGGG